MTHPRAEHRRRYTGISDGIAKGPRPGLLVLVEEIERRTDGGLWNNGTFANRNARGKQSMSVHATGRAVDLSYRNMRDGLRGKPDGLKTAREWMRLLVRNAEPFGVECILDYQPQPWAEVGNVIEAYGRGTQRKQSPVRPWGTGST